MSKIFEHGYAVVIGVDENNISRLALPTVAKDVQAVHDVLVHPERCAYKPDNVKLLKGAESTKTEILDALYWLQDKVKEDAEATAVLYYSGHGMVDKATDQYYLIPYNIRSMSRVRADAIKAEELTAEISTIKAKRMLAILDCCHAAGMDVKDIELDAPEVDAAPFPLDLPETKDIPDLDIEPGGKAVSDLLDGQGRAVLNSSTGAQSSYIRTDGKMSLFTYHLIEALTGHAPHAEDAAVVYVTDVMSWVTHKVKQSAKEQNRDQTPVMRTSGVFPVAQLIGGQGVAKGLGGTPPDPLAELPPAGTTFNQQNQTVHGAQVNVGGDAHIGQIGNNIDTGGGDYVEGDMVKKEGGVHIDGGFNMSGGNFIGGDGKIVQGDEIHGDKIGGDKVAGDKVEGDQISVGNITGATGVAIGRGAQAHVQQGVSGGELAEFFQKVHQHIQQRPEDPDVDKSEIEAEVQKIEAETTQNEEPNENKLERWLKNLASMAPDIVDVMAASLGGPVAGATAVLRKVINKVKQSQSTG
ncbi:caspase family protein [Candidatus Leptofilum sp.]|uniref:caspase family protein n=1 Tax=Candidatus Leptofilum sp. TaxID=3241576 RepID=UPI003B598FF8